MGRGDITNKIIYTLGKKWILLHGSSRNSLLANGIMGRSPHHISLSLAYYCTCNKSPGYVRHIMCRIYDQFLTCCVDIPTDDTQKFPLHMELKLTAG
jgi:hypothetical protein